MIKAIFSILFICTSMLGMAQFSGLNDGPYIFYKDGKMIIETIAEGQLNKKTRSMEERSNTTVEVAVPGKPGSFFKVDLKPSLDEEPSEYKNADRIFAISDIEGTFESFRLLLTKGGVINENLKWTYGDGHLVIVGDVFDRGQEVTACLWLIYKLEEEAKAKGGYVHLIMGNHEIMNLSEDIRYVHEKYLQAATIMERTYMDFYAPNTELGIWLRTKNIIEKIGKNLFTHGGISQSVNETGLSLKKINARVRPLYDRDGLDSIIKAAKATTFFQGHSSPFWYRGYFVGPKASIGQIDSTLQIFSVNRIIVGHTLMDNIKTFYNGKVVAIDVNHHAGNHQALIIEKDRLFVMDAEGNRKPLEN